MLEWIAKTKFVSTLCLAIAVVATIYAIDWVWGALFVYFAVYMTYHGEAFLVEPVRFSSNPILCSAIVLMWFLWGIATIAMDIWPVQFYEFIS